MTTSQQNITYLILGLIIGYVTNEAYNKFITGKYITSNNKQIKHGIEDLIGNTPMVLIKSLSEATGCKILAKAEYLNPGGSPKDRVALGLILSAEKSKLIRPHSNYTIYEGTVGSTGISLALICKSRGYQCYIVMPDDMAIEKYQSLLSLGAIVEKVRPASIVDPGHFVNIARKRAQKDPFGYFVDQFENLDNLKVHKKSTGPEIMEQTKGEIHGFVAGAGTGGTLAGVSSYLKSQNSNIITVLADPQGSGLHNKVQFDTLYTSVLAEGTRTRHQIDTLVEGIGLTRLTKNFNQALNTIDLSTKVSDQQAVDMSRWLMEKDGNFI
ncbi:pyridoxal phosphate-dependent enzyme, beta subunit [Neoconidiobolus thromboides FSU 785]|nr:pyridoxal phosphate-dependent enzyme, beta subunit [Neoconidiobolus thromboides FSU 785]